jgi:hypothetical protein
VDILTDFIAGHGTSDEVLGSTRFAPFTGGRMKNKLLGWEVGGFFFITLVGSALHFTFELSNFSSPVVAFFSAVNESIWEHLKMVFWPGAVFALVEYSFVRRDVNNFLTAKTASLFTMPMVIATGWYAYTAFTGRSILQIDGLLFFLAALTGQLISYRLLGMPPFSRQANAIAIGGLVLMLVAFSTFTYRPPHISLFEHRDLMDTGQYGILDNHDDQR